MNRQTKINYTESSLPNQWINEEERNSYLEELEITEAILNGDIKEQVEAEGLEYGTDLLKAMSLSPTAILAKMEQAFRDYRKMAKFLPNEEAKRVENSFLDIAVRLEKVSIQVFNLFKKYPFDLVKSKNGFEFDKKQVETHIAKMGVREFTDTEKKYYKLIDTLTKVAVEAHNFEVEHGLPSYATMGMQTLPNPQTNQVMTFAFGAAVDAKTGKPNLNYFVHLDRGGIFGVMASNLIKAQGK